MTLIRSCLTRRIRFAMNQALRPTVTPSTKISALTPTAAARPIVGPVGSLGGLVSRRHLRVTHTPPQTPPMPPMDLRYNYAAGVFIVVLFTWAALSPEDDGFNTLLGGSGMNKDEDEDEDDDDDERYDGTGYEGRDKALSGGGGGGDDASRASRASSSSGDRPVVRD
ncbi:unnamed protein product [Ectocarpus sp. CCAP 1310/34]|nr:unnamed protein product [Ectocarpus sp. CCAP 1310/34]